LNRPEFLAANLDHERQIERQIVSGLCGICPAGCGVRVHLHQGRIERLTPEPDHPLGLVCPRGAKAAEVVYSPDRLLYPQRRVGARGEGRFERIGWDEAYDIWVAGLQRLAQEYGPESLCMTTGRGNFEYGLCEAFGPARTSETSANGVLFPFGSPNATSVGALCYASYGMIAPEASFGLHIRELFEDIENADLILVWGNNPATDSPPLNLRRIKAAKRRGARVIVIDHRRSECVNMVGAEWIGVRPGSDAAIALAAIRLLIEDDLIDREFISDWCLGFEELRDYVADFTPQRAEALSGVPADTIRDLAHAIGTAKGCSVVMLTGLEFSNGGVQTIRAIWTLQALAGHLDVPGGKLMRCPSRLKTQGRFVEPPAAPAPIGADDYPLYHQTRREAHGVALPRAILESDPYPVRGLIVSGASLLTAWPDPDLWSRALRALDLLVAVNRFPTADMAYADLVLPAATPFESESYMIYDGHIQYRRQIIEPQGESRSDYLIFAELAERLGYGELWPQSEAGMIERALEGTGIDLDELKAAPQGLAFETPPQRPRKYREPGLRADGLPGFPTPSGKFEIASSWLAEQGYEALPVYVEPEEGPLANAELAKDFPLVLSSGARTQTAFRSQHFNIPGLIERQPEPLVHLHEDDARPRGIVDGDRVWVISPRGRVRFTARVGQDVVAGAIEANMGGGGPLGPKAWQEANVNALTDADNRDPISGFPVYKALLAEVVKA
jgi:anaerobic selenocysteine-containing dehydrogenase